MTPRFKGQRVTLALLAALAVGVFVSVHAFTSFQGTRVKLVRSEQAPTDGAVRVSSLPRTGWRGAVRLAVIATVSNHTAMPQHIRIAIDDRLVCDKTVGASASPRVDCASEAIDLSSAHRVDITGPASGWTVDTLELATHHGRSSDPLDLIVLPRGGQSFERPGAIFAALIAAAVLGLLLLPASAWPRRLIVIHRALIGLAALFGAVVVLAPFVSPFFLIVSIRTTMFWLGVSLSRRLWTAIIFVFGRAVRGLPASWNAPLAATLIALLAGGTFWMVVARDLKVYNGNYSGFIHIAKVFVDRNPLVANRDDIKATLKIEDPGGYDGQFMYFAAFDPFLLKLPNRPADYLQVMDDAMYRYSRIGYSVLINWVSLGDWHRFPTVMIWLLLGSVMVGAFALAKLAQANGLSAAWGALMLLVPAFWQSILSCLPESLAAALLIAGYLLWTRGRSGWAALAFGFALLVRETTVIFVLAVIFSAWRSAHWRRDWALVLALLPLAVWRTYLGVTFMPVYGLQAFTETSPVLGIPFAGAAHVWGLISRGAYYEGNAAFARASYLLPALQGSGLLLSLAMWRLYRRPIVVAAVIYSLLAVSLNYDRVWVHVGNAQRVSYEMFVVLAIITVSVPATGLLRRAVWGFWAFAAVFVFYGAYDAQNAQNVLLNLAIAAVLWFGLRNRVPSLLFKPADSTTRSAG